MSAFFCPSPSLLKPCPTNHILNEALAISSSEGPFLLNPPKVKIEGYFNRSHLPKENLPKTPMNIPIIMNPNMCNKDFEPSFTPKWAGFTDDQKVFLFSTISSLSSNPGSPSGDSVRVERVLPTRVASAEGSVTPHRPIFFWCSIISPLGGGPGICNHASWVRKVGKLQTIMLA